MHYLDMVPLAMVSTGTNIKPDGTPGPPQVMKCGCCPVARHIKFETHVMFRSGVLGMAMDSEVQSLAIVQQAQRFYAPFLKLSMGKPFSFDGPASSAPSGSDVISSAALAATDNIAAFVHYDCPPIEAADRQALKAAQGNGCGCCKAPLPAKVFKELAITQDKIVLSEHGWNWGKEETYYQIQTHALDQVASTAMQQTYPMMVLASKCCGCCGVVPATLFHNHVHGFPGTKLQLTGTVDDFVTDWVNTVDDPSLETAVCRISEFVSARANDRVNAKVMNRV